MDPGKQAAPPAQAHPPLPAPDSVTLHSASSRSAPRDPPFGLAVVARRRRDGVTGTWGLAPSACRGTGPGLQLVVAPTTAHCFASHPPHKPGIQGPRHPP